MAKVGRNARHHKRNQTQRAHLPEGALKEAVRQLDHRQLRACLQSANLDVRTADELGSILLRSSIVQQYPDPQREASRNRLLAEAVSLIAEISAESAERLSQALAVIPRIEAGYRSLLEMLRAIPQSDDPAVRLSALLALASRQLCWALSELDDQFSRVEIVDGLAFTLPDGAGGRYPADQYVAMLDVTTSATLRMYANEFSWTDIDGAIVIPDRVEVSETDLDAAQSVQDIAQAWDVWRRIDDGLRFLGGSLEESKQNGEVVLCHQPTSAAWAWERVNRAAHEQLTVEIASIFNKLAYREDAHARAAGIDEPAELYPRSFISITELQAAHALDLVFSTSVEADTTLYGGLRLIEWIRGYSLLSEIANRAARASSDPDRLLIPEAEASLLSQLARVGLTPSKARLFLKQVTFGRYSRDLADEPLLRMNDKSFLIFGPTLANAEIARVLMSKLSRERVSFERRGRRFEREMRERFADWGFAPSSFTARRGGEAFEYDLVVPWDDHLFIFECKSRDASGTEPSRLWQAQQVWRASLEQTKRLAQALAEYPDILDEFVGSGARSLHVIPCVLNALPFQIAGPVEGVYFTDLSAVATFFELGEVGAYATHRVPGLPPVRQRLAARSLWAGSTPTALEFIRYLDEAPTLEIMLAHLRDEQLSAAIGRRMRAKFTAITRLPDDAAMVIEIVGGDSEQVMANTRQISKALQELSKGGITPD